MISYYKGRYVGMDPIAFTYQPDGDSHRPELSLKDFVPIPAREAFEFLRGYNVVGIKGNVLILKQNICISFGEPDFMSGQTPAAAETLKEMAKDIEINAAKPAPIPSLYKNQYAKKEVDDGELERGKPGEHGEPGEYQEVGAGEETQGHGSSEPDFFAGADGGGAQPGNTEGLCNEGFDPGKF